MSSDPGINPVGRKSCDFVTRRGRGDSWLSAMSGKCPAASPPGSDHTRDAKWAARRACRTCYRGNAEVQPGDWEHGATRPVPSVQGDKDPPGCRGKRANP